MKDVTEQKTCRFDVCNKCTTICCQGAKPPLTPRRARAIDTYLKKHKIQVSPWHITEAYSFPAMDKDDFCVFFSRQTGKCIVHPVKPETCVAGPITFDINLKTGKTEWFLKKPEICSLSKILYENSDSFETHFAIAKKKILRLIREIDPSSLRTILTIEEPLTFKIGESDIPIEILKKLHQ